MGPDLDLLDEILLGTTAKTVRVGSRFKPKLRPKKASSVLKPSVESFDKAEKVVSDPMVTNELSASPVHILEDLRSVDCVNKSMDHVVAGETVDVNAGLNNSEFLNNVDAYFGLESLEDSCSQPTTAVDTDVKDSKEPSRTTIPGNKKLSELDEPQDYFGSDFECAAKDSFSDRVESASHMQEPPSTVSSDEIILDEFSFAFPENDTEFQPYTSLDSTSELPGNNESLNEEPTPPVEISQEDISFSAMDGLASKVSTEGNGRIESEEADNNDDDRVSDKCKKKPPAKSKRSVSQEGKSVSQKGKSVSQKGKSVSQKGKSVSKRKRGDENQDEPTEKIPKRLPKRKVNKALLETPEEELDLQQISIRDIILLAEHREKLEKNAKAEESRSTNPSASNSIPQHKRDETASEQAGFNNEETDPPVQDGSVHTNYHSYMEKTPRVRWSKQDTELFYQAVRQFGSDLSFIQQLFPGLTRTQIKLKYKKEERQNPVMLHDALTGRAKDNSHFEHLIKLLKKDQDDAADLASNEDLGGPEISGEEMEKSEQVAEKNEQEEEIEKVEPEKEEEVEKAMEQQAVSEIMSSPVKHNYDDDGFDSDFVYISEL